MKLHIIVPCYNEEPVLNETCSRLSKFAEEIKSKYSDCDTEIVFVDDGSRDSTWQIIESLCASNGMVHGLKLSRNEGHQKALWAGLEWSAKRCDCAVTIDADLQDDVNAIAEMVENFRNGDDVVYGVRKQRKTDTFFKRFTAQMFYKMMIRMGVDLVYNHADFRLMSRRAIEALLQHPERNIFLRGMVRLVGYKSSNVYYDRSERFAGESKYPLSKMLTFAIDGVTSFSIKPLGIIAVIGVVIVFLSILAFIYALVSYFRGVTIQGWTSILMSLWLLGGMVLFSIGILGEYIGKIYTETKDRPHYFIEKEI